MGNYYSLKILKKPIEEMKDIKKETKKPFVFLFLLRLILKINTLIAI